MCAILKRNYSGENALKSKIKIRTLLIYIILLAALSGILLIYPGRMLHNNAISSTPEDESGVQSSIIDIENSVMQEFYPEQEFIKAISIKINSLGQEGGLFYFNLYDKDLNKLCQTAQRFRVEGDQNSLYYRFPVSISVLPGEPYYYTLDFKDATFSASYSEQNTAQENGRTYYSLKEIPGYTITSIYEYEQPLDGKQIGLYILGIIIIAVIMIAIVATVPIRDNKKRLMEPFLSIKILMLGWVIALLLYAIYQVGYKKVFTYSPIDIIVLLFGSLVFAIMMVYGIIQYRPKGLEFYWTTIKKNGIHYIQSIVWSMAILACIDFVNAGSNYAQGLALREMCSWFGLAMLVQLIPAVLKKIRYILISIFYMVGMTIAGYYYMLPFVKGEEAYETAIRTILMIAIWLILTLTTIIEIIIKRPRFSWRNLALTGLFFICLLLFRRSNVWELAVVIPFTVFIIRTALWDKNEILLNNIGNGIILSFFISTCDALLHRPFHYYLMIRYSGVFTTVTVTSVYLGLVFTIGVVRLFGKLQKSTKFSNIWMELSFIGIVSGYQFLTLSRTGILTCAGVFTIAILIHLFFSQKKLSKKYLLVTFQVICSILVCVPMVFSMTRMIPAIVNDPKTYEIEIFLDSITKGEPINSARYITVERFLGLSTERILGRSISEENEETKGDIPEVVTVNIPQMETTNTETVDTETVDTETADTETETVSSELSTVSSEYSNGRFDIFRNYLDNLNLEGHDAVGLTLEDGTTIIHAHNSFIQMAYDCGILTGFIFIVLYIMLGFRSIKYYLFTFKTDKNAMMPMLIFAAFGIASMVEYVFRPTIPLGFVFIAMLAPLLTDFERRS